MTEVFMARLIDILTGFVTGPGSSTSGHFARWNNTAGTLLSDGVIAPADMPLFASGTSGTVPASGGGTTNFLRADGTWTNPSFPTVNANSILGNNTGGSTPPTSLTGAQVTAMLSLFASGTQGLVPASGGGTANFLRADGTFATPLVFTPTLPGYVPASGGGTVNFLRADGTWSSPEQGSPIFSAVQGGDVPASGGGTTNYLRADGTWSIPSASIPSAAGTSGQIQWNNSGSLAGFTASGDATIVPSTGVVTVTKTSGVAFAPSATTDTTNASNITSGSLLLTRVQTIAALSVIGNPTGGSAVPVSIGNPQYTLLLSQFTPTAQGVVPASGGGTANFLRADGTWQPAGGGGGGTPGGVNKQFQYDNAGAFGGANVWFTTANQVDHSNSATAQVLRVYNTTDNNGGTPTNAEWATIDWTTSANVLTIGTNKSGTGAIRNMQVIIGGAQTLDYGISNAGAWTISGTNTTFQNAGNAVINGYLQVNPVTNKGQIVLNASGANFGTISNGSGDVWFLGFVGIAGNVGTPVWSWNDSGQVILSNNAIMTSPAAATLQLGAADAAAPVAQIVQAQSVIAGTTSIAGQPWTFNGSRNTGATVGGDIVFNVAPSGVHLAATTCTISIASPAVITINNTFQPGQPVVFSTTGALPTGLVAGTTYYVIPAGLSGTAFQVAAAPNGAAINTSGSQSGVQSVASVDTAQFGLLERLRLGTSSTQFNTAASQAGSTGYYTFKQNGTLILDYNFTAAQQWFTSFNVIVGQGSTVGNAQLALNSDGPNLWPQLTFNAQGTSGFFAFGPHDTTTHRFWFGQTASNVGSPFDLTAANTAHFEVFNGAFGVGNAGTVDTYWLRAGAANVMQLAGTPAGDVAAPTAMTLGINNVLGGTSNTAGAAWNLQGSLSTGTGLSGNIIFNTGFQGVTQTSATVTLTIASPCVVSLALHQLVTGQAVQLATTGALPTGLTAGTTYYVISNFTLGNGTFQLATSAANALAGIAINTSGSQSGTQTLSTVNTVQNTASPLVTLGPSTLTGSQTAAGMTITQNVNNNVSGASLGTLVINQNQITLPSQNLLTVFACQINGTNVYTIDGEGRMLIGLSATQIPIAGGTGLIEVANNVNSNFWNLSLLGYGGGGGGAMNLIATRGALGAHTAMQNGDGIGSIYCYADDGSNQIDSGRMIGMNVDQVFTSGSGHVPTRTVFETASISGHLERLRIDSNGNMVFGYTGQPSAIGGTYTALTAANTVTISIASPAVITLANHGYVPGQAVVFTTTGALPTGITSGTVYYVIAAGLTSGAFEIAATPQGAAINTSGSQSGTQTCTGQNAAATIYASPLVTFGPSGLTGALTTAGVTITQTWNTTGVADATLLVNSIAINEGINSKVVDFQINGVSTASLTSSGTWLVGTTSDPQPRSFGSQMVVATNTTNFNCAAYVGYGSSFDNIFVFATTTAATPTGSGIVVNGQALGGFSFLGDLGSGVNTAARAGRLTCEVDGVPSATSMPGRLAFWTAAPNATGSPATKRFIIDSSGNAQVISGTLGYGTGVGGTVTQATSRTTGVTLNKICGQITMFSAAGSATAASFTVTNSTVAATDTIILNQASGTNLYELFVTAVAAGSFQITFLTTGGTATDAPVINFSVIKAVTA